MFDHLNEYTDYLIGLSKKSGNEGRKFMQLKSSHQVTTPIRFGH